MMKKLICMLGIVALATGFVVPDSNLKSLKKWLAESSNERRSFSEMGFSRTVLNREEAREAIALLTRAKFETVKAANQKAWDDRCFRRGSLKLAFKYVVFGEKPADGRSLYISMHGGGNAPASLNNQQWDNQIHLYTPEEGVYLAPRAPWDDWNMWFKPGLDEFFDDVIRTAVAVMDVNPDKVYIMGYSAGGDGVWRLAPRMADRWAAASMMAGHPGEASLVNLRNLPFMIWMGELDGSYNRNQLAKERGLQLDSLRSEDPEGYVHETCIVKGKSHWMERKDTLAISWMSKYRRNPYPEKIVWRQEEVGMTSLYWLAVPSDEVKHGAKVIVEQKGNVFNVLDCDYKHFTIRLNDRMVNLDQPVSVLYRGKELFKGKVKRNLGIIYKTLEERVDPELVFSAEINLRMKD